MNRLTKIRANRSQRRLKVTRRTYGTSDRPRLSVKISLRHIYAQVIDDDKNTTIISASTLKLKSQSLSKQAELVGQEIAKLCKTKKITKVVLDRGRRTYHGRLKILSDAARQGGLNF